MESFNNNFPGPKHPDLGFKSIKTKNIFMKKEKIN